MGWRGIGEGSERAGRGWERAGRGVGKGLERGGRGMEERWERDWRGVGKGRERGGGWVAEGAGLAKQADRKWNRLRFASVFKRCSVWMLL